MPRRVSRTFTMSNSPTGRLRHAQDSCSQSEPCVRLAFGNIPAVSYYLSAATENESGGSNLQQRDVVQNWFNELKRVVPVKGSRLFH